jgi:hypothetical protein
MTRHLAIFLATFALGAVIAVVLRAALHRPYQDGHPAPPPAAPPAGPGGHEHAAPAPAASAAPASAAAVNTVCAICGMAVDPALGTIAYKGRQVGFGCRACPPKFKAEPEKYGEAALKNQVVE